ncbi:filamentous hemagglutinin [Volucribacter psittacicida]|uniref:Filamentous hemagglutinin n=1 Tax=Volucribacter psittacicida TaxID=203482 RepID=A0A4R1G1S6_9PAST|nr:hemagglutinin repeat-containing protein [Volucribacter psittacicida]TCK01498.1 filamentous hemagglutinin [Volucribacter psittacicida]
MNKYCYRVIFNKSLSRFVVVSELAKTGGKSNTESTKRIKKATALYVNKPLTFLSFACYLALGFVSVLPAQAEPLMIVSDPSAADHQRPIVLETANGLPQVNIQTPNEKGLSYNRYQQFDVDKKGAILNNSRKATSTQLAGMVQGNPYLAAGEAKVIVNEVNSSKPSQLKGYIEVAGKKADIVIANPSGLHCEGCGVINANRTTMTTGKVEIQDGELTGFIVEQGAVKVSGKGMDNRQSDYTDIIARHADINAGIWANKGLKVTTGQNKVSYNNQSVQIINSKNRHTAHSQPEQYYAVDIGELGGMYAGKIHLIGTEQGLGVRNFGHIGATAGDVVVDSAGNVVNQGQIQAIQEILLVGNGKIENQSQGKVIAGGKIRIQGQNNPLLAQAGLLDNSGLIQGKQNVSIKGTKGSNQQSGLILSEQGDVSWQVKETIKQVGGIAAKNKVDIKAQSLTQEREGEIQGQYIDIALSEQLFNQGVINSRISDIQEKSSTLSLPLSQTLIKAQVLTNQGTGRIFGDHIAIETQQLFNQDEISEQGEIRSPVIAARERFDIGAKEVINQSRYYTGYPEQATSLISLGGLFIGEYLDSNYHTTGKAERLVNRSGLIEAANGHWRVNYIENNNAFFRTEQQIIAEQPVNWSYIVPKGSDENHFRIAQDYMQYRTLNRGKTRNQVAYMPKLEQALQPTNGDVKSYLLPEVNQCLSGNSADCELNPKSYYFPDNPVWLAFGIQTQQRKSVGDKLLHVTLPTAPTPLIKPTEPKQDGSSRRSQLRYQQALVRYQQVLEEYQQKLPLYEQELAQYQQQITSLAPTFALYKQWVEDNSFAFEQLSREIKQHNQKLLARRGAEYTDYWVKNIDKQRIKADTVVQSQAGKISIGRDLSVESQQFINDKSQIILGGVAYLSGGDIDNIHAQGSQVSERYGNHYYSYERKRSSKTGSGRSKYRRENTSYYTGLLSQETKSITLPVAQFFENYQFNDLDAQRLPDTLAQQLLPTSSLYQLNPEPNNRPLIETDSRFTDRRQWLSGEYMFNALRYEHSHVHKRLGDGYYEQQKVAQQLHQLTGKTFNGDRRAFEEQYKQLMDNGIVFAKQFNLSVGIKLSAEQVKNLTSDIVWFELEEVRLPDGRIQQVYQPKVYVMSRRIKHQDSTEDVQSLGTLLHSGFQANDIYIDSQGTIRNTGKFIANNILLRGHNIEHQGNIIARQANLQAKERLSVQGGEIEVEDNLMLKAHHLTLSNTLATDEIKQQNYHFSRQNLDRQAKLYVKNAEGALRLNGDNIELSGIIIRNDGKQTEIRATQQLNIGSMGQQQHRRQGEAHHQQKVSEQSAVITHLQSQGDVLLQGKDIHISGSEINSQQKLVALAENQLILDSVAEYHELDEYHYVKNKGLFSSSSYESSLQTRQTEQRASKLNAQQIQLQADRVMLKNSQLSSKQDIDISAKQSIHLAADYHHYSQKEWQKYKKTGISSALTNSVAKIGFQYQRSQFDQQQHQSIAAVSQLSAKNQIRLSVEQGALTIDGAKLKAGQNAHLQAAQIDINSVYQTNQQSSQFKQKAAGFGVSVGIDPVKMFKRDYEKQANQGSATGIVGKIITTNESIMNTFNQVKSPGSPYLYANRQQQQQYQSQQTALASQIDAGGNLTLVATEKDIVATGAVLSAKQEGRLIAKRNIILDSANTSNQQQSDIKRNGIEIDLARKGQDAFGAYYDKNQGQAYSLSQQGTVLSFGGESHIIAQQGDVMVKGAQIVSEGRNRIYAGGNIQLDTAQSRYQQSQSNKGQSIGTVAISDTERFSGYNRLIDNSNQQQVSHSATTVASLNDKVEIYAGGDFNQTSAKLLSQEGVFLSAKSINMSSAYNLEDSQSHRSDLKIGQFSRIISPIIDVIQAAEQAIDNKEASDRVKAAQAMGLAAQGYTTYKTLQGVLNNKDNAVLFRAESGTGFSHAREDNYGKQRLSVGNVINGREVSLVAREGDIHGEHTLLSNRDEQGNRLANSKVILSAEKGKIHLYSGQDYSEFLGKNQSSGVEVGTAVSVGAKTGWSFYGKAGFSKGKNEYESLTQQNSRIDTESLFIQSKGDTLLTGAAAYADKAYIDVGGDLHIESQQDRIKSKSHQGGVRVHVEGGFGSAWQFSGSASLSGGNAYYEQVKEQSGLFLGDGGYHIKANNVNLVGGVISSTNTVNSELITNQITFRDIDNRSDYGAFSGSLEGSISGKQAKNTENQPSSSQSEKNGKAQSLGKTLSTGLPLGSFGHDSSVTKATLTEGRIVLNKDSAPIETSAAALGINTELSHSNRQVAEVKDIQGVLKEQKIIQASVSEIRKAVGVYGATKAQELNEQATQAQQAAEKALQQGDKHQAEQHMAQAIALQTEADKWRIGGAHRRLAEAITTGLGLVLAGKPTESIATGVASPYINQAIKQATEQYPEFNIPAHILWGAIEAELLGGQASTGAVAAGVGELGAKVISEQLYGKSASELTEQEKQEVLVLSQLAGAVAGGLSQVGQDSISLGHSAALGGEVARNAVENNYLFRHEAEELVKLMEKNAECKSQGEDCSQIGKRIAELHALYHSRSEQLAAACRAGMTNSCAKELLTVSAAYHSYDKLMNEINQPTSNYYLDVAEKYGQARHLYMEDVAKEALIKIAKEGVHGSVELIDITSKAIIGDSEAQSQLKEIGQAIKDFVQSPLENTSDEIKQQLAEADRLEAMGRTREADLKRMEVYLSTELGVISAITGIGGLAKDSIKLVAQRTNIPKTSPVSLTCSFHGDMQVKTQTGYTAIANLNVGDKVLAKNAVTGISTYQQVQAHYSNPYDYRVYIEITDSQGQTQTIISNKIHPFFAQVAMDNNTPQSAGHNYQGQIENGKWINAEHLQAGFKLLSESNRWQRVERVTIKKEPLQAYNLTVAQDHSYFVKGKDSLNEGVWVHNDCWHALPEGAKRIDDIDGYKAYQFADQNGQQVTVIQKDTNRFETLNHQITEPHFNRLHQRIDAETGRYLSTGDPVDGLYNRSYLRSETLQKIFAEYKELSNGDYLDSKGNLIKGPIDIGHAYGWEHRRLSLAAKELNLTQQQLNDYVNARPERFRLENRSINRSHKNEMPGKNNIKDILEDMNKFLAEENK